MISSSGVAATAPVRFNGIPWLAPLPQVKTLMAQGGYQYDAHLGIQSFGRGDQTLTFKGTTLERTSTVALTFDSRSRLIAAEICIAPGADWSMNRRDQEWSRLKAYYTGKYGPPGIMPEYEKNSRLGPLPWGPRDPWWPKGVPTLEDGPVMAIRIPFEDPYCQVQVQYRYGNGRLLPKNASP